MGSDTVIISEQRIVGKWTSVLIRMYNSDSLWLLGNQKDIGFLNVDISV